MTRIKQKYGLLILGVLIGAVYGVVTRVVFGERATLASITYLFLIPAYHPHNPTRRRSLIVSGCCLSGLAAAFYY